MSGRNHDLPILDELGTEFAALVEAEYGKGTDRRAVRRRAPLPSPRGTRERRAQATRIGRRAAIVLVLVCLVGGVAFAALRGGGSGDRTHTSPTLLGRDAGGAWSFSVYRDGGRLCTVFVPSGGELNGSCGPPPRRGRLRAGSAIVAGRRYVFGVTGAGVARAVASLAERGLSRAAWRTGAVRVRRPVDPDAARDAGFPAGDGWFVIDLGPARNAGLAATPAVINPLTRQGDRAGPPYVDCSLGALSHACVRRIESAARG